MFEFSGCRSTFNCRDGIKGYLNRLDPFFVFEDRAYQHQLVGPGSANKSFNGIRHRVL